MSWIVQMFGWFSAEAARASRRKRVSAAGSSASSGKKLQRDEALQPRVLGLIDHAHSAAAELLEDAVVRDRLADQGRRLV